MVGEEYLVLCELSRWCGFGWRGDGSGGGVRLVYCLISSKPEHRSRRCE